MADDIDGPGEPPDSGTAAPHGAAGWWSALEGGPAGSPADGVAASPHTRQQQDLLGLIFDNLDEPIALIDQAGGVLQANRAYRDVYGDGGHCYGWSADRATPSLAQSALQLGRPCRVRQTRYRADGAARFMDVSAIPVTNAGRALAEVVEISRDVTEQVELERQLQQAWRLDALSTLAGGIAHEFNNLLFGILGFSELIRMDVPDGSIAAANVQQVLRLTDRAREIVQRVQAFGRDLEVQQAEVDLAALLDWLLRTVTGSLGPAIRMEVGALERAPVLGDSSQLLQALTNVLANALDSLKPGGGLVAIGLRRVALTELEARTLLGLPGGAYALVEVSDTGPGIPRELQDRIFEPFFTGRPGAAGLGLSVAHGIVTGHGGTIVFRSVPGYGTTFTIALPLLRAGSAEDTAALGDERVLVVDGEAAPAELLRAGLSRLGYRPVVRGSAAEAVALLRATPEAADVVLLAHDADGRAALEPVAAMRACRPGLAVLLVSWFGPAIAGETVGAAFDGFLAKPLVPAEAGRAIRRAVARVQHAERR